MSSERSARLLLQSGTQAVLATLALEPVAGFPFASAVPYCLDAAGRPLLPDLPIRTAGWRRADADGPAERTPLAELTRA